MDKNKINKNSYDYIFSISKNFISNLSNMASLPMNFQDDEFYSLINSTRSNNELIVNAILDNNNEEEFNKLLDTYYLNYKNNKLKQNLKSKIYDALKNSYCSIFKILEFKDDKIYVENIFLNKREVIENMYNLGQNLITNNFVFARIINFDDYKYLVHILEIFTEKEFKEIMNYIKPVLNPNITNKMTDTEKIHIIKSLTLNIYFYFALGIQIYIEKEDDNNFSKLKNSMFNYFFDEDDKRNFNFSINYMKKLGYSEYDIFLNLDLVFSNSLKNLNVNFSNINEYSYKDIFKSLAEQGKFLTDYNLYNCIEIMTLLYKYLLEIDKKYEKPFFELLKISENIFIYKNLNRNSIYHLYFDFNLYDIVPENIKSQIISDFDYFLESIDLTPLKLIKNNTSLSIKEITLFQGKFNLTASKITANIVQKNYPLLEFFFNFSIIKNLCFIDEKTLFLSDHESYSELTDQEKYCLIIYNLLNDEFTKKVIYPSFHNDVIEVALIIKNAKNQSNNLIDLDINPKYYFIIDLLRKLNILIIKDNNTEITELGINLFNYFANNKKKDNIIYFPNN